MFNVFWVVWGYLTTLFSCAGYVKSDNMMTANNELDRIRKEPIVAYFKIPEIPCRSSGLPEKNRGNTNSG
jgi:hypothetical protein